MTNTCYSRGEYLLKRKTSWSDTRQHSVVCKTRLVLRFVPIVVFSVLATH